VGNGLKYGEWNMTADEKQKLVAQFNEVSNLLQAVSCPAGQGFQFLAALARLGAMVDAIKPEVAPNAPSDKPA
jgi:hypothetical protein